MRKLTELQQIISDKLDAGVSCYRIAIDLKRSGSQITTARNAILKIKEDNQKEQEQKNEQNKRGEILQASE